MNALEIIYEGYLDQEHEDGEEVRAASAILEDQLAELLPIEKAEQLLMDALVLSSESMRVYSTQILQVQQNLKRTLLFLLHMIAAKALNEK